MRCLEDLKAESKIAENELGAAKLSHERAERTYKLRQTQYLTALKDLGLCQACEQRQPCRCPPKPNRRGMVLIIGFAQFLAVIGVVLLGVAFAGAAFEGPSDATTDFVQAGVAFIGAAILLMIVLFTLVEMIERVRNRPTSDRELSRKEQCIRLLDAYGDIGNG